MEKMTFADRLNAAMRQAGHTQASLGEAVGMAQPSVWKLTSGVTKNTRKLYEISRVLGVRPEWLSDGAGEMMAPGQQPTSSQNHDIETIDAWDETTPLPDDEVEVPFLRDIELAAGDGSFSDEDYNGYKLRFSKSTLRRVGAMKDNVLCFPARGNSMEPIIPDGTTVAIDCASKSVIDGKLYAIATDGMKRIKQLYRRPGGIIVIRSFNREEYADENVSERDIEILGRVFWYSVIL